MKISDKIKNRILIAKKTFNADDNISEYIEDGEINLLIEEVAEKFEEVLRSLIIDTYHDPNSIGTAKRLAKMYILETMAGRYEPAPNVTSFPNTSYDGMLVIRAEIKSMCSHHHQPVTGVAYIGIIPTDTVAGLSKYIRIAQWCARRGTLQEELCLDIADEIKKVTNSSDVAVHIGAEHGCCTNRGVSATSSLTQTTILHGRFHDADVKNEFFQNISLQQKSHGHY